MEKEFLSPNPEEEISLKCIFEYLEESWKTILTGTIIGTLLGFGYSTLLSGQYQGIAHIQNTTVAGVYIEPISNLLEKIKLPGYFSDKTYSACNVDQKGDYMNIFLKNITLSFKQETKFLTISYTGTNQINTKKCIEHMVEEIIKNQNKIAKEELGVKYKNLNYLKIEYKNLINQHVKDDYNNLNEYEKNQKINSRENRLYKITDEIRIRELELIEPNTKSAYLITPIYIYEKNLNAKKNRIILAGLIAGLFFSLFITIFKNAYHSYKKISF